MVLPGQAPLVDGGCERVVISLHMPSITCRCTAINQDRKSASAGAAGLLLVKIE